jgi:hypothetical protein
MKCTCAADWWHATQVVVVPHRTPSTEQYSNEVTHGRLAPHYLATERTRTMLHSVALEASPLLFVVWGGCGIRNVAQVVRTATVCRVLLVAPRLCCYNPVRLLVPAGGTAWKATK